MQKLQERLGKRQDGGDRSCLPNHTLPSQQHSRSYGATYDAPAQGSGASDLSQRAQPLTFDASSSAFEVFNGRGSSAAAQQFLAEDDEAAQLDATAAAAGAADSFMLSFADVPSMPLTPPIAITPAAAAGDGLPFPTEGEEPLVPPATPAAVCGPQSGGLVPCPPAGIGGAAPGASPASTHPAASFPDPPASAGKDKPAAAGAATPSGRAAGGGGPKWPCGPLLFLDRSADAPAAAAAAAAPAAGKGAASAGGPSASPSFQLHSPSPLISSQTMASWGAVEEPAAQSHTPAHVRPQSMGLPSPGGADWLLGLTGGARTPGLWAYLSDSAFAALPSSGSAGGGGGAGGSAGDGGGSGFSLGPTPGTAAAAAAAAFGGLDGLWGGRERSADGLLGGLCALARSPTVAQTPGSGSGGSGSGSSAQEGFWSGLLTPSATSPPPARPAAGAACPRRACRAAPRACRRRRRRRPWPGQRRRRGGTTPQRRRPLRTPPRRRSAPRRRRRRRRAPPRPPWRRRGWGGHDKGALTTN